MKFSQQFKKQQLAEWSQGYINYEELKTMLKPYKRIKNIQKQQEEIQQQQQHDLEIDSSAQNIKIKLLTDDGVDSSIMIDFNKYKSDFQDFFENEFIKFNDFFKYYLNKSIRTWLLIKINLAVIKQLKVEKRKVQFMNELKLCFEQFYKEIILLIDFVNVNEDAIKEIIKKLKAYNTLQLQVEIPQINIKQLSKNSYVKNNINKITNLKQEIINVYLNSFYSNSQRNVGEKELEKIQTDQLLDQNEFFLFGVFVGICTVLFILNILLLIYGKLDFDSDMKYIFPCFRVMFLICLYLWTLSLNILSWQKFHINYKQLLSFNYHSSSLNSILLRSCIFFIIYQVFFLFYVILDRPMGQLSNFIGLFMTKRLCPLMPFLIFIVYMIFPSKTMFNGVGRIYLFKMMYRVARLGGSTSYNIYDFVYQFMIDQVISMIIILTDIEYMICFYSDSVQPFDNRCYSSAEVYYSMAIALIIYIYRVVFQAISIKQNSAGTLASYINLVKYIVCLIIAILSAIYYSTSNEGVYYTWLVISIINAILTFVWDVKVDWKLFDFKKTNKNILLRDQLSFSKEVYYIAIIMNIFLRMNWIFIISPGMLHKYNENQYLVLVIGILEMIRRGIWNSLRIEKEHLKNLGLFQSVGEIKLPFKYIQMKNEQLLIDHEHSSFAQQKTKKQMMFKNRKESQDEEIYEKQYQQEISEHSELDESNNSQSHSQSRKSEQYGNELANYSMNQNNNNVQNYELTYVNKIDKEDNNQNQDIQYSVQVNNPNQEIRNRADYNNRIRNKSDVIDIQDHQVPDNRNRVDSSKQVQIDLTSNQESEMIWKDFKEHQRKSRKSLANLQEQFKEIETKLKKKESQKNISPKK